MSSIRPILVLAILAIAAPPVFAQGADPADPEKEKKEGDKPPEEEFDPSLMDDVDGENPDNPDIDLVGDKQKVVVQKKKPRVRGPSKVGYPMAVGHRPITLKKGLVEPIFQYRVNASPFLGEGLIGGRYGITDQIQAGLRYGIGAFGSDLEGYEAGRVVSLDFEYLIQPWVAGQLSLPILFDPFAVGITLGAPMKFIFFDKLTLQFFRDLVSFRTNRFVPSVESAVETATLIALDESNTGLPDGEINIEASALYQQSEKMAFELRAGLRALDFALESDSPRLFDLGFYYTHKAELDFGGRLGFADLGQASDTFNVIFFAQYRMGFDQTPASLAAQVEGEVASR